MLCLLQNVTGLILLLLTFPLAFLVLFLVRFGSVACGVGQELYVFGGVRSQESDNPEQRQMLTCKSEFYHDKMRRSAWKLHIQYCFLFLFLVFCFCFGFFSKVGVVKFFITIYKFTHHLESVFVF